MGTELVTDVNGIVTGSYRMVHRYPFSGRFQGVECKNGKSVGLVTGLAVRKLIAQGWKAEAVKPKRKGLGNPAPVAAPAFTPTQAAEAIGLPPADHKDFVADLEALPKVEARPTGGVTMTEKPRRQKPGASK